MFWDRPLSVKVDTGIMAMASYNDNDSSSNQFTAYDIINFEFKFGNSAELEKKK
ncbi:MAG: hypothetical protein IPK10_12700 [Bacteroidetes bacterium]|nr:hypothetical protein [Bacteroidota bacterium]